MRPEPCEVQDSPAPYVVHGRIADPHAQRRRLRRVPFPSLGGRGFTLLNVNYLKRGILNLSSSTYTRAITQSPLFNRVKGRGSQMCLAGMWNLFQTCRIRSLL
jgi:hypothetical protein